MFRQQISYKDYRIGKDTYTVKFTQLKSYNGIERPVIKLNLMTWHMKPQNLIARCLEKWKYNLSTVIWNPLLTTTTLDEYCVWHLSAIHKTQYEWEKLTTQAQRPRQKNQIRLILFYCSTQTNFV